MFKLFVMSPMCSCSLCRLLQAPLLLQNLCHMPFQMRWWLGRLMQKTLCIQPQHRKERRQDQRLVCRLHGQSDSGLR